MRIVYRMKMRNQMSEKKYIEAVTSREIVKYFIEQKPTGAVAKIAKIAGVDLTGEILEMLEGENLYIPGITSQCRAATVVEVLRVKKLRKNSYEYREKLSEMKKTYNLTKKQILQILRTGNYQSVK